MNIISSSSRGTFQNEWLHSQHSFSFGDYYDPQRMGFSSLRVINEDWIAPNTGFPMHGHRDMEIITYVMQGELTHKDSLGNGSTIRSGEVQRMSAGRGILHSESNPSATERLHLLQIWIQPKQRGIPPGYTQQPFPLADRQGRLQLLASTDGRDDSLIMHSDAALYGGFLKAGENVQYQRPDQRSLYVHVARGTLMLNGLALQTGDAEEIRNETRLDFTTPDQAEFLLFELP